MWWAGDIIIYHYNKIKSPIPRVIRIFHKGDCDILYIIIYIVSIFNSGLGEVKKAVFRKNRNSPLRIKTAKKRDTMGRISVLAFFASDGKLPLRVFFTSPCQNNNAAPKIQNFPKTSPLCSTHWTCANGKWCSISCDLLLCFTSTISMPAYTNSAPLHACASVLYILSFFVTISSLIIWYTIF